MTRSMDRHHPASVLALVTALLLAFSTQALAQSPSPASSVTPPPAATQTAGVADAVPDTPAGDALGWLLDVLADDPAALDDAELERRFAPVFLEQIPPEQTRSVLAQTARQGPWRLVSVTEERSPTSLDAIIASDSAANLVTITTEGPDASRIAGLRFQPAPARTWEEVDAALQRLGPRVGFLAARVDGDACVPVHGLQPEATLSIASAFKLYVLGALGLAIEAGEADWSELLPIDDSLDSLPSGRLQHVAEGTPFTLRYYAELMIAQSDNTATDHLIDRLGRDAVVSAMATMGHADPQREAPLITTAELFRLKYAVSDAVREAYLEASSADRREILANDVAAAPLPDVETVAGSTSPRFIEELGWYASPADLCAALAFLWDRGGADGLRPLVEVASINRGLGLDPATWPTVLFKGGSEAGVLNLSFLLQRSDGTPFILTLGVNDPDRTVSTEDALAAVQTAAGYLAGIETP